MSENERPITGSTELAAQIREAIYDLALAGEEFSYFDVILRLGHDPSAPVAKTLGNLIGSHLRSAATLKLILSVRSETAQRPMSPEAWRAGARARTDRRTVYRGNFGPAIKKEV